MTSSSLAYRAPLILFSGLDVESSLREPNLVNTGSAEQSGSHSYQLLPWWHALCEQVRYPGGTERHGAVFVAVSAGFLPTTAPVERNSTQL